MSSDSLASTSVADGISSLQAAAIPLPTVLREIARELPSAKWTAAFQRLALLVEQGAHFSQALDDPAVANALPGSIRDLLRTQHTSGLVGASLEIVEVQRAGRAERSALLRSLAYPCAIMLLTLVTCGILAWVIINFVEPLLQSMEVPVSSGTRAIHRACRVGVKVGTYGAIAVSVVGMVLWLFGGTRLIFSLLGELPLIGPALRWSSLAQWLRTSAIALDSGANLPAALRVGAQSQEDIFVTDAGLAVAETIEQGTHLASAWQEINTLPMSLAPLWRTSAATSSPAAIFRAAADLLSARSRLRAELVTAILPPLLFILVGSVVTALLWSIISPLHALVQGLSGGMSWGGPATRGPNVDLSTLKLCLLLLPGATMLVSLRIMYGPRQSADPFRKGFAAIAWSFVLVGILGLFIGLLELAVFWMFPITVVILLSVWVSLRRSEDRSFLHGIACAAERGIPIVEIAQSFGLERHGRRCRLVATALQKGMPLSQAIRRGGISLPGGLRAAIALGERGGAMGPLLQQALRPRRPYEDALQRLMRRVLMWLGMLAVASFFMLVVVGVLERMLDEFGIQINIVAYNTFRVRHWLINSPWPSLATFFAVALTLLIVIQQIGFRTFPSFPWLRRRYDSAMVLHLLSAGIRAKHSLSEILQLIAETYDYRPVQRRLQRTLKLIEQGSNPWQALQRYSFLRSAEAASLSAAERVGNLPAVLDTLSDTILRRLEFRLHLWTNVLNTGGLIVVGFSTILGICCVILPIAELVLGISGPLR